MSRFERSHPLNVQWRAQSKAIVDLYVELLNGIRVVIEYDGVWWHRNRHEHDKVKTEALLTAGYTVIRVREYTLTHISLTHSNLYQFNHGTQKSTQSETLIPKLSELLTSF